MLSLEKNQQEGFTLIETLIYIALFGMILTGVIVSAYPLFTNTERSMASVTDEGEAAFILRKLSWMMNSVEKGTLSVSGTSLSLIHASAGFMTFRYDVDDDAIYLDSSLGSHRLNATRTKIDNFLIDPNYTEDFIEISFETNDQSIGPVRYYSHVNI